MKKIIYLLTLVLCLASCNSCKDTLDAVNLNVERITTTDKEYMFTNYTGDYKWYETCILLNDYLDEECDGTIASITNVFQVVLSEDANNCDTNVILAIHTPEDTNIEIKHGFWVEDFSMNDEEIKIPFTQAFENIMKVNYPKPHSRHVVLRKEVGPFAANPQYIFGNQDMQLYVDAITGEVTDKNPAFFPKE